MPGFRPGAPRPRAEQAPQQPKAEGMRLDGDELDWDSIQPGGGVDSGRPAEQPGLYREDPFDPNRHDPDADRAWQEQRDHARRQYRREQGDDPRLWDNHGRRGVTNIGEDNDPTIVDFTI